jgi:hypothetical protein
MARLDAAIARLRRIDLHHSGLTYLLSTSGGTTGSLPRDMAIKLLRAYERDRWRVSPRRFAREVDHIPLRQPIFLVGTQGAGETIIGRCLRRNRSVVSVSGNSDHWTGGDEMGTIRNRMSRLPPALWGSKHRADVGLPLFGTDQPYGCSLLLPLYRRTADDATAEDARRFRRVLREHIAVYARDPRNARFLDKTHAYTLKMPLIAALLRDAHPCFVLVMRNPYETCRWMLVRKPQLFGPDVPPTRRLELVAEHWSNTYRTALRDAERVPSVAVVRFEDFVAETASVVRALSDFVQLEFDPAMVPRPGQSRPFATLPGDRKWHPLYQSDWLSGMTAGEEAIIAERCQELADRFRYTARGALPTESPIELLGVDADELGETKSAGGRAAAAPAPR